jgi:hypothetical protein
MAAVEAGMLPRVDETADMLGDTSRYAPNMANHERYRIGRDRQERLEQTLALIGEFV